ncbi:transglutaminase family protein [Niveispirillum sp. SYP-B3756]|uniref:transglutaminase family protein n=1 Tax=Niveispirillum sp. SYP-B3756 TaxID=2662178 RepID=UPI001290DA7A|nr:transglutaminase family protein [Niveispirillum sp. SYP-B3756]MQP66600.1 transglutaminase family protein [Niveispirillum sp. SYP-B3756]
MGILTVTHKTTYDYANPVVLGPHRMMFRPRDSHDLRLLETGLVMEPAPSDLRWMHDVFGNSVALARFDGISASRLTIESRIVLEQFPAGPGDFALEDHARHYPFSYDAAEVPDLGRTMERHYPDPDHKVDEWARQFVRAEPGSDGLVDTLPMLRAMTAAIRGGFTYQSRDAEGTQSPVETLERGSGSCRDFALLMMEAARSLGFAARFVSGYLYDPVADGAGDVAVGAGATHAWMQVYLPGAGWVEFDPTNGIAGGRNLIRVAVTRDASQAVPLAGQWTGAPADYRGMTVSVNVTAGRSADAGG